MQLKQISLPKPLHGTYYVRKQVVQITIMLENCIHRTQAKHNMNEKTNNVAKTDQSTQTFSQLCIGCTNI